MERRKDVVIHADHLETLRRCGGYYKCPDGSNGLLVGYAGRYSDNATGKDLQYVGKVYYNFARAEEYPHVLDWYAELLADKIRNSGRRCDVILAMPMGGITTGFSTARHLGCNFAFLEKKVVALATAESRERSELNLNRHEIDSGSEVWASEDVCNNFSTVTQCYLLLESLGSHLAGIACLCDRSMDSDRKSLLTSGREFILPELPVEALLRIPTAQYRQDDPEVIEYIRQGRVVLKPKDRWEELQAVMAAA